MTTPTPGRGRQESRCHNFLFYLPGTRIGVITSYLSSALAMARCHTFLFYPAFAGAAAAAGAASSSDMVKRKRPGPSDTLVSAGLRAVS